jgi:[CysO sulfur-carrier protein]-S-L-cysteine hydrolase
MRLRLPADKAKFLLDVLQRAGNKEVGGQLFGEQLAPSDFRVTELTLQKRPGTFARFIVDLVQAARDAASFFDRTAHRYTRFNYIGEWHSHPNFKVHPSGMDITSMQDLVSDHEYQGNFAVLLIVRIYQNNLMAKAWLYDNSQSEQTVNLEFEL